MHKITFYLNILLSLSSPVQSMMGSGNPVSRLYNDTLTQLKSFMFLNSNGLSNVAENY